LLVGAGIAAFWLLILVILTIGYFAKDLPNPDAIAGAERRPSVTVLAEDGTILASYGDLYGNFLPYDALPPVLVKATIAIEDRRFFDHFGIDVFGLARALFRNTKEGRVVQGGSTITQQLAKNLFLSSERTYKRKVQEVLLSFWLEQKYEKEEIMSLYLNLMYMGAGRYGVDAASKYYFHKPGTELTLPEAAMLAGLFKAPSRYTPSSNPDAAKERAKVVLDAMVDNDAITPEEAMEAKQQLTVPRKFGPSSTNSFYAADWILEQIPADIRERNEDLIIKTTLDAKLQRAAEQAVAAVLDSEGKGKRARQAALVAMEPDGTVRAIVGGRKYQGSQYNRATTAKRQPGSAFKLFVYAAAMQEGYAPEDMLEDAPFTIKGWTPKNYDNAYRGTLSLRDAFTQSVNTIAAQLGERVGRAKVVNMAQALGIASPLGEQPSLALGTSEVTLLELTTAYAHFAHQGQSVIPHGIIDIRDRKQEVIYKAKTPSSSRVLSEEVVGMMNSLMQSVVTSGTGRAAAFGPDAAGKTGTSQDFRDAWFIGFTSHMVTGVWVGNDDNTSMKKVTGGTLPAKIWKRFMKVAHEGVETTPLYTAYTRKLMPWQQEGSGILNWLFGNEPAPEDAMPTEQVPPPEEASPFPNAPEVPQPAGMW
jgi:penicillin-binding protein 1A